MQLQALVLEIRALLDKENINIDNLTQFVRFHEATNDYQRFLRAVRLQGFLMSIDNKRKIPNLVKAIDLLSTIEVKSVLN